MPYNFSASHLADNINIVSPVLSRLLSRHERDDESELTDAMRYACLNGGKMARPFIALHAAKIFDVPEEKAVVVAAALEMLHVSSCVHDDILDDDNMRHGQPSVKAKYGDGKALLAGNALNFIGMEVLANAAKEFDGHTMANLFQLAAKNLTRLQYGVVRDLETNMRQSREDLLRLYELKSGVLFETCAVAGGLLGKASEQETAKLSDYAINFGIAYQIANDMLDKPAFSKGAVGKIANTDDSAGKVSFVTLYGLKGAQKEAQDYLAKSITALDAFGAKADPLRGIADYMIMKPVEAAQNAMQSAHNPLPLRSGLLPFIRKVFQRHVA